MAERSAASQRVTTTILAQVDALFAAALPEDEKLKGTKSWFSVSSLFCPALSTTRRLWDLSFAPVITENG